jgi:hypothetical protein
MSAQERSGHGISLGEAVRVRCRLAAAVIGVPRRGGGIALQAESGRRSALRRQPVASMERLRARHTATPASSRPISRL